MLIITHYIIIYEILKNFIELRIVGHWNLLNYKNINHTLNLGKINKLNNHKLER